MLCRFKLAHSTWLLLADIGAILADKSSYVFNLRSVEFVSGQHIVVLICLQRTKLRRIGLRGHIPHVRVGRCILDAALALNGVEQICAAIPSETALHHRGGERQGSVVVISQVQVVVVITTLEVAACHV
jgi:hypothetical protein